MFVKDAISAIAAGMDVNQVVENLIGESDAQDAYRAFFKEKLDAMGGKLGSLSDEKKKAFFNDIKKEWASKKAEAVKKAAESKKEEIESEAVSQEELDKVAEGGPRRRPGFQRKAGPATKTVRMASIMVISFRDEQEKKDVTDMVAQLNANNVPAAVVQKKGRWSIATDASHRKSINDILADYDISVGTTPEDDALWIKGGKEDDDAVTAKAAELDVGKRNRRASRFDVKIA